MVGSGPALITTPLTERGIAMPNLPRIEAIDADSAVAICCDVLAFIQLAVRALSEADFGKTEAEAWHGLAWLAEMLNNTLAEVERKDP